jgi:RNA polymerase sigma factor (sigma-70 family)
MSRGHEDVRPLGPQGLDAYRGFARAQLRRFGVSTAELDDLQQEVFLVALASSPSLADERAARAWLVQVCRRIAADARRSRARVTPIPETLEPEFSVALSEQFDREAREKYEHAMAALAKLSRKKQEVLALYGSGELSMREVAERFGEPESTVYVLYRAAVDELSRHLRDEPVGSRTSRNTAPHAPADPGSLSASALPTTSGPATVGLVRPLSSAEEQHLKKRALEAAFQERERLLEASLTTAEVARLLRVSRQTPHDRVKANTLLAIEDKGALRFPLWQFDPEGPGGVVCGLPDVLKALSVGEFAKARWLERPNPVFENRSPLEVLKAGEVERVVREARGVGAAAGHG